MSNEAQAYDDQQVYEEDAGGALAPMDYGHDDYADALAARPVPRISIQAFCAS